MFARLSCIFMLFLLFFLDVLPAQCLLQNVSLEERSQAATHILAAEVLPPSSFFNQIDGHIYTLYPLENLIEKDTTWLAIRGGAWEGLLEIVNPSLRLTIGERGVFFLKANALSNSNKHPVFKKSPLFNPAIGVLSFLKYDEISETFRDPLNVFEKEEIDSASVFSYHSNDKNLAPPDIVPPIVTSITPSTVTAGTETVITLTGNHFGNSASGFALIEFRNPDITGFVTAYQSMPPDHILSWTNTEIQIIVPGRDPILGKAGAGSGNLRIRNPSGEVTFSNPQITVRYNRFVESVKPMLLIDDNGFGGYTFTYNQNFHANNDAVDALERALETWQCSIHSSFVADGSTTSTNCPTNDGLNLISFDDNCQLPIGLLAQTTHWFITCPNGNPIFLEMDLIFDSGVNWHFGTNSPPNNKFDFESLALHEFGHGHGIGHVREVSSMMFPTYFPGIEKRTIDTDTEECGNLIVIESSSLANCGGNAPFVPLPDCSLPCSLSVSAIQSSGCLPNEFVEYTLNITDINGSSAGFNILINGIVTPESPITYNVFGTTTVTILLPANGSIQQIEVQDVLASNCSDATTITPPNCQCSLELSLTQISNCSSEETLLYTLTILDNNGGTSGFEVLINGNITNGSPYNYSGTGSTFIDLELPGNGMEQSIEIRDLDDTNCQANIFQETTNCQCVTNLSAAQTGTCDANNEVLFTLTVEAMNGSTNGFDLFIDGQAHPNNPYFYNNSGTTIFDITLSGDNALHTLTIIDLNDPECTAMTTVNTPDCTCFLQFSAIQTGTCNANDEVIYSLLIESENTSNSGFNVFLDNTILAGSPFPYNASGTTIFDIEIAGDGSSHELLIEDVINPQCFDNQTINSPNCICQLTFSSEQTGVCSPADSVEFTLTLTHQNASSMGFNVLVNNELLTDSPFAYHPSGTTAFMLELAGNGSSYPIQVVDVEDGQCADNQIIATPDCICELNFILAQNDDCTASDSIYFDLTIFSKNGSTGGFNIFVDEQVLAGSPFDYASSDTTILTVALLGNGNAYNIQIEDTEDEQCADNQTINTLDYICELNFTAEQEHDCFSSDSTNFNLTIFSKNGSASGFNVHVDGDILASNPFTFHPSDTTSLSIPIIGDGLVHNIQVSDIEDEQCSDNQMVISPDCACSLFFLATPLNDCNTSENTDFNLFIISNNGSSSGFNIVADGELMTGSPFSYDPSDTTILTIQLPSDGNVHELQIIDVEDETCSESQSITTPDCTCTLTFSVNQIIDCNLSDSLLVMLIVESENGSSTGFNVFIDNQLTTDSPFAYDISGTTSFDLSLFGNGNAYSIEIKDAENIECSDNQIITTPDCVCELTLTAEQTGDCDTNGDAQFTLTIESENGSTAGFDLWLDGSLITGSPFTYDGSGTTLLNLAVEGDAAVHHLELQDKNDDSCGATATILTPDCSCKMQAQAIPMSACSDSSIIVFELLIEHENGSAAGFQVWIDAVLYTVNPFDYESGGVTSIEILVAGDGLPHSILIQDIGDSNCQSVIEISPPDCACQLATLTTSIGTCNVLTDEIPVEFAFKSTNGSSSGFQVWIDGILDVDSPFDYAMDDTTVINITLPGDTQNHSLEIRDVADPSCLIISNIPSPNCQCEITLEVAELGSCNQEGEQALELTITAQNYGMTGFQILVNGVAIAGTPFDFNPTGMTVLETSVLADASVYLFEVQDVNDENCTASAVYEAPDCTCFLDLIATSSGDCLPDGTVLFELFITDAFGSNEGFNILLDGIIWNSIPLLYSNSNTTIVEIPIPGDGTLHDIEVIDLKDENCTATFQVTPSDCACSLTLTATQSTDCDDNGNTIWTLIIEEENGSNLGFNLFLDGELVAGSPFNYSALGTTLVDISVAGDGGLHTVQIVDANAIDCEANTNIVSPDCTCELNLIITQVDDCDANDSLLFAFVIEANFGGSSGFNLLIDNILHPESPFSYQAGGITILELNLDGDGALHNIEVIDILTPDCKANTAIESPECLCSIAFTATQVSDCNAERSTTWSLAIEDQNGSPEGFDVYLNGESVNPTGYIYTTPNTFVNINIPGDGNSHSIKIQDKTDALCLVENIILAPDCACYLWLEAASISDCDEAGTVEILGSLTHELVFADSFQLFVNGVLFSPPLFAYEGNDFSTFQINLAGDGTPHLLEVHDNLESNCTASTMLDLPNCDIVSPSCELEFSEIQALDCEDNTFEVTLQFEGPKAPQNQFHVFQNGALHPQSPFNFHISGLNTLFLETDCDTLNIQITNPQITDCQIDTTIFPTFPSGHFNLYPNPLFYQNFELLLEGIDVEDYDKLHTATIFDVLGRTIFKKQLLGRPLMTLDLKAENLAAGMYYFVMGSKAKYQGKLVVLK